MSAAMIIKSVLKLTPHISLLVLSLIWIYITLGFRVRKTRKAFEKQLIGQGMSKENAKHISSCFEDLKNNLSDTVKQGLFSGFTSMAK